MKARDQCGFRLGFRKCILYLYRSVNSKAVLNLPHSRNMEMGEFGFQPNISKGKKSPREGTILFWICLVNE